MTLPGNNEIHYCPAALMAIIEKHINAEVITGNLTVQSVSFRQDSGTFTTIVRVTTDKQPEKG